MPTASGPGRIQPGSREIASPMIGNSTKVEASTSACSRQCETPAITVYQALGGIASSASQFQVKPSPGELQTIYSTIAADISHGSSSLIN